MTRTRASPGSPGFSRGSAAGALGGSGTAGGGSPGGRQGSGLAPGRWLRRPRPAEPPESIVSPIVEPFQIKINNDSRRNVSTRLTPNTDIDGGGSTDDITSSIDSGRSTDDKTSTSSSSRSLGLQNAGVSNYMRYPVGRLPSLGYDYIQIRAFKYAAVGLPKAYSGERKKAKDRLVEATGDIIQLPMIGSISETNAVSWSDDFIGEIQNIAAGIAMNKISTADNPLDAVVGAFADVVAYHFRARGAVVGSGFVDCDILEMAIRKHIPGHSDEK